MPNSRVCQRLTDGDSVLRNFSLFLQTQFSREVVSFLPCKKFCFRGSAGQVVARSASWEVEHTGIFCCGSRGGEYRCNTGGGFFPVSGEWRTIPLC